MSYLFTRPMLAKVSKNSLSFTMWISHFQISQTSDQSSWKLPIGWRTNFKSIAAISHVGAFHWRMNNLWSNQSKIIHLKEEKICIATHPDGFTNTNLEFRQKKPIKYTKFQTLLMHQIILDLKASEYNNVFVHKMIFSAQPLKMALHRITLPTRVLIWGHGSPSG